LDNVSLAFSKSASISSGIPSSYTAAATAEAAKKNRENNGKDVNVENSVTVAVGHILNGSLEGERTLFGRIIHADGSDRNVVPHSSSREGDIVDTSTSSSVRIAHHSLEISGLVGNFHSNATCFNVCSLHLDGEKLVFSEGRVSQEHLIEKLLSSVFDLRKRNIVFNLGVRNGGENNGVSVKSRRVFAKSQSTANFGWIRISNH